MRQGYTCKLVLLLAVVAMTVAGTGCGRKTPAQQRPKTNPAAVEVEPTATLETSSPSGGKLAVYMAPAKAQVAAYEVNANLSNIQNMKVFAKLLNAQQKAMIAKNCFVVTPTKFIQLFQVYEDNNYARPRQIPSFITVDSMLHTYHIFYDFSLRKLESGRLYDRLQSLTSAMLKQSEMDYGDAKTPMVKEAARGNVAYFAVAAALLGKPATPSYVASEVKSDLARIEGHKERAKSDVLSIGVQSPEFVPVGIDFTQFVPRGHYTRSALLKKYFKAMMWYGLASMALPRAEDDSPVPTLRAALLARSLSSVKVGKDSAMSFWEGIYEPTAFYVGVSDDLTPDEYKKVSDRVYGKSPKLSAFEDAGKLKTFVREVDKLRGPGIENFVADYAPKFRIAGGKQMRFMGQRFVVDSRVFQELTLPKVDKRGFPKGLDLFSAVGSKRAAGIMEDTYHETASFPDYPKQMAKMRKELSAVPLNTWQSNLYYGWLWSMWPIAREFGKGYPSFMTNRAWTDKSLNTGLGWWTELRHDTILYAKQSVAECGGDGEEPPLPKGYVEPNVELWSRLLWLTDRTERGLKKRGLLTDELAGRFDWMSGMLQFLKSASIKELVNKQLTTEEYEKIRYFGADLENQMIQMYGGDIISETDKNMAVVADVHTSGDTCLEEGVGRPSAIYVAVPIGGKLYLTRGAVFSYPEFIQPSANRLTDEQWQKMLEAGKAPGPPEWTRSFMLPSKKAPGDPEMGVPNPGGC